MISGWNSDRYSASTAGVSRAGSQVMKIGVREGWLAGVWARTKSIMVAILSSSSGQMSGQ